jgi:hypothetical protein
MADINPTFNNQVTWNQNTVYFMTSDLKKKIVKQLEGKSAIEQEAIIETLLKMLDCNLLAALAMSYSISPESAETK